VLPNTDQPDIGKLGAKLLILRGQHEKQSSNSDQSKTTAMPDAEMRAPMATKER